MAQNRIYKGIRKKDTKLKCPNCDGFLIWVEEMKAYICEECGYEEER